MRIKILLILSLIGLFSISYAQKPDILPIGFYPGEEALMEEYLQNIANNPQRGMTMPPGLPTRTAAQWEEVQALVITWTGFPSILAQIVDAAQEECTVIIHCDDSNSVKSDLIGYSVPLTNVKYIEVAYNSIWIRDYGANTVYLNDVDSLVLVDWIYNRPRPDDDVIPDAYAALLGIPLFSTTLAPNNLMNTGGNWMIDGMGTTLASELVLDENDGSGSYALPYPTHTEAAIDAIALDYHGTTRYAKMTVLPYDGIHHIDMHTKFLDEKTILFGEFPAGQSDGPQMEANIAYILANYNNAFGDPYKIVRIPMPPSTGGNYAPSASYRTYTNFVIVNKTIIMPGYRTEYDTTALRIIKENMPGYNVVMIDADNAGANIISQSGVIHCITHTVGVKDPLRIVHDNLEDTYDDVNPYQIDAIVQHKTGIANATVYWTLDTSTAYTAAPMTLTNVTTDTWSASIPAQAIGTTIYYYIHAQASSGKQQVRPMVAPDGIWQFDVLGGAGIEDNLTHLFGAGLYPNPSHGITCIPFHTDRSMRGSMYVTDMTGKIVQEIFTGDFKMGDSQFFINTETWRAGVYTVVAATNEGAISQKLIVR
jgi:agmatine deiminase